MKITRAQFIIFAEKSIVEVKRGFLFEGRCGAHRQGAAGESTMYQV